MNYYNIYRKLPEEEKRKYKITSSTDDYPHLYTPSYSSSSATRYFSARIESSMTSEERKDICRYAIFLTKGKCAYCGKQLVDLSNGKKLDNLNWDHIYPASKYNILTYGNVLLSCSNCNINKNDSDPLSWYESQLISGSIKKGLFSYDEMEQFLDNQFELYAKNYPWARIVKSPYFQSKDNADESDSTLYKIHKDLGICSLFQNTNNSSNQIKCSVDRVSEIEILIQNIPLKMQNENFNIAKSYFLNNFGYVEMFLDDKEKSLLNYNNFVWAIDLFLSIIRTTTFNKMKYFSNTILEYYFKRNFNFYTKSTQIIYLKKPD